VDNTTLLLEPIARPLNALSSHQLVSSLAERCGEEKIPKAGNVRNAHWYVNAIGLSSIFLLLIFFNQVLNKRGKNEGRIEKINLLIIISYR